MSNSAEVMNEDKKNPFDELSKEELIKKCKGLLVIAQKAKVAKAELQSEVESYKLQLEKCETEKKISVDNAQSLQEFVDSLTEQKVNYLTELHAAQTKIKALSNQCGNYEAEISKYKESIVLKDQDLKDVYIKISDLDSELISLRRQNKRLLEENEQLVNQLTEIEARTEEFNKIGLQQMEQLKILEDKVVTNQSNNSDLDMASKKIVELEGSLQTHINNLNDNESKIKKITLLYESEKEKKDKAYTRLRSYKDKIIKCASCIEQLKNDRFILSKTVKEYSESIPKWQSDIIKASKFLDVKINDLCNENKSLKTKLQELEKQIVQFTGSNKNNGEELINQNKELSEKLESLKQKLEEEEHKNKGLINELNDKSSELSNNGLLNDEVDQLTKTIHDLKEQNREYNQIIKKVELKNSKLNESVQELQQKILNSNIGDINALNLQIKALESEKATLVKEKSNARDNVTELEHQNNVLSDENNKLIADLQNLNLQHDTLKEERNSLQRRIENESKSVHTEMKTLQEDYKLLKKEYENIADLNNLLKDEVETLKLSLEQPQDDTDSCSGLNALQTDIVKLETKLSAYKHENSSLLTEIKESRLKVKEAEAILNDYEDLKSKLLTYKKENSELLSEMKEYNQELKERGESISKLQKAEVEMERLLETLERERDQANEERDSLCVKLAAMERALQAAEQNVSKDSKINDLTRNERDEAVKTLKEKENTIEALKDEIERLKNQQVQSDVPADDNMSTSTISKSEEQSRMNDLDESFEEKYTKLRIFALKLKKKLNETNIQLQNVELDKSKLEKVVSDLTAATAKGVEEDNTDENKANLLHLQVKIQSLTDTIEGTQHVAAELDKLKAELNAEKEAHKTTKDNLEKARRDVKKRSVLSLEMEDYERSMKELTTKMEDSKKKMIQMESTIDTQEGTIAAMKTQIKLLEEQIKSEEKQNRNVKEELQTIIEEGKEKENIIQIKNGVIAKLEFDLEDEKRKNEDSNIEMTSLLTEKEKIIMSIAEEKIELNNKLKRMEFRCADLEEKVKNTNIELEDLKTEYTSYKVRAQAVLRQNQTVDHSQEEQLKEEAAALKAQMESLSSKLTMAQEKCAELQSLADLERRKASDANGEVSRAEQRMARLQADLSRLATQLESERSQHKLQTSTLTQCYKTQLSDLESRLLKEIEDLKRQLNEKKSGLIADKLNSNINPYMLPVIPKEDNSDGEMDISVAMLPREEGEGSEAAPSPPLSKSFLVMDSKRRSPVPLDRLLEEGVPDDENFDTSAISLTLEQEVAEMKRKLLAQHQRVKHITVLLSESERECARYAQMNELLKAEVRRARGSLERTEHAHNAEYMKNVTLKFLTLPPGDERSRLVPVLQKILTLTPDETQKINAVAKGADPNPGKGWGSYLPWPGGN